MKAMEWIWLIVTILHTIAVGAIMARPYDNTELESTLLEDYFNRQRSPYDEDWEKPSKSEIHRQEKRGGCGGFPCMLTHIGNKAGSSSLKSLKMSIIRDCLNDPLCFGQGRRKRSKAPDRRMEMTNKRGLETSAAIDLFNRDTPNRRSMWQYGASPAKSYMFNRRSDRRNYAFNYDDLFH